MNFRSDVSVEQYDKLLSKIDNHIFLQDNAWFETIKKNRNVDYKIYGVFIEEVLVSACIVFVKNIRYMSSSILKKGPIYTNPDSAIYLIENLIKVLKTDQIIVEPHNIYMINDEKIKNDKFIEYLYNNSLHSGYHHHSTFLEQRCSIYIDGKLPYEQIYKNYKSNFKKKLKVSKEHYIYEIIDNKFDIDDFLKLRTQLSEKKNFDVDNKVFYESLISNYKEDQLTKVKTKTVRLNVKLSIEKIKDDILNSTNEICELEQKGSKKGLNKINILKIKIEKCKKQLEELFEVNQDYYDCAIGIFFEHQNRVCLFQLHNNKQLNYFKPHYLFYDKVYEDYAQKVEYIDLFGVPGRISDAPKNDSNYGTLIFKLSMSGEFVEYHGHFYLIKNKMKSKLIELLVNLRNKIRGIK